MVSQVLVIGPGVEELSTNSILPRKGSYSMTTILVTETEQQKLLMLIGSRPGCGLAAKEN